MKRLAGPGRRIYYGWPMLIGLSAGQVTSWGILYYCFAVFLSPMHADLGWSIAQMTGAYSLALLISAGAAIPVGHWLDRHGPRALMTISALLAALLVIAWSQVDSLASLYLIWAAIGITMAGLLYEPAFVVVANWFIRRRNRALTILTVTGGLASVVYIPLATWLIGAHGWRSALLVLAGIMALGTIPIHALLLRRRPEDIGLQPDGDTGPPRSLPAATSNQDDPSLGVALRGRTFWWIAVAFFLARFGDMAITIHLIPLLIERGNTAIFAATAAAAIGLVKLPGRVIFAPLAERIDLRVVIAMIFATQAVAFVVLVVVPTTLGVVLFVALFGAVVGAVTPSQASLTAMLYGRSHYGAINGALATTIAIARSIAPLGAGLLYALAGSYSPVVWLLVVFSVLAAIAVMQARPQSVAIASG